MNSYIETNIAITLKKNNIKLSFDINYIKDISHKQSVFINNDNISKITETKCRELLKAFECNDTEINKLVLPRISPTFNPKNIIYQLTPIIYEMMRQSFEDYIVKPNAMIDNKDIKKLIEKSVKTTVNYEEFNILPKNIQALYEYDKYSHKDDKDAAEFIYDFIKKNQEYITQICISINDYQGKYLNIKTEQLDNDKYHLLINKKITKISRGTPANAVPIYQIKDEYQNIFNKFDEERFTSGINLDLLSKLDGNLITMYYHIQSDELINKIKELRNKAQNAFMANKPNPLTDEEVKIITKPFYLSSDNNIPIKCYTPLYTEQKVNNEYAHKLNNALPKEVDVDDLMYLFEFITHNLI